MGAPEIIEENSFGSMLFYKFKSKSTQCFSCCYVLSSIGQCYNCGELISWVFCHTFLVKFLKTKTYLLSMRITNQEKLILFAFICNLIMMKWRVFLYKIFWWFINSFLKNYSLSKLPVPAWRPFGNLCFLDCRKHSIFTFT